MPSDTTLAARHPYFRELLTIIRRMLDGDGLSESAALDWCEERGISRGQALALLATCRETHTRIWQQNGGGAAEEWRCNLGRQ